MDSTNDEGLNVTFRITDHPLKFRRGFTWEMGFRTRFWHNTSHWGQQVSIGPVTELVWVGQVEKREPPQTGAPGARVPGQPWLEWDCDVKKRRKVPFTTFPANSAAFAARRAPAAAARASLFLTSSCSSVSARSGSSGRRQRRSICARSEVAN